MLLGFFQQVQMAARTTDMSLVAVGCWCRLVVDVDAAQLELLLQVVVVVHGDALSVVVGQKRQQSLGIHGRRAWLEQVQVVKSRLEERREDFVFFHEKRGLGHQYEFHQLAASNSFRKRTSFSENMRRSLT